VLHLTLFLFCVTVDFRRSNTMPSQRHSALHRSALPSQWRKSMAAKGNMLFLVLLGYLGIANTSGIVIAFA
jgi:hypothetical protein